MSYILNNLTVGGQTFAPDGSVCTQHAKLSSDGNWNWALFQHLDIDI
jgi:hypothetical protein